MHEMCKAVQRWSCSQVKVQGQGECCLAAKHVPAVDHYTSIGDQSL